MIYLSVIKSCKMGKSILCYTSDRGFIFRIFFKNQENNIILKFRHETKQNSQKIRCNCLLNILKNCATSWNCKLKLIRDFILSQSGGLRYDDNGCHGSGEMGTFIPCWWECKLVHPLGKSVWRFFRKRETDLKNDPAPPLVGTHSKTSATASPAHPCFLLLCVPFFPQPLLVFLLPQTR